MKLSVCNACELKVRCTSSERGRVVYRPFEEDFYDSVRGYRRTYPYEKALRKRKVWVEPWFAETKERLWHKLLTETPHEPQVLVQLSLSHRARNS